MSPACETCARPVHDEDLDAEAWETRAAIAHRACPTAPPPHRVWLRRTKGWRLPENTVVVTRGPGRLWGNPYVHEDPRVAVAAYRALLVGDYSTVDGLQLAKGQRAFGWEHARILRQALPTLRGKNLACWCKPPQAGYPDVCHAAVLLELANQ